MILVTALTACATDSKPAGSQPPADPRSHSPSASEGARSEIIHPNAADTGVPAGTALQSVPSDLTEGEGWRWTGAGVLVDEEGATLRGLDVAGSIEVRADDVTIARSRITAWGDTWAIGARDASGLVVSESTISGGGRRLEVGVKDICGCSEITVLRNDIADWATGIQLSRGLVEGNYVHDPKMRDGDHVNGFTHNGGREDGHVMIRGNTILNAFDQTDAVSLFEDFGTVNNVTVQDNLLAGGSYSLYAGGGSDAHPSTNIVVTNNRFSTRFFDTGGAFGPVCCFDRGGNAWGGKYVDRRPTRGTRDRTT